MTVQDMMTRRMAAVRKDASFREMAEMLRRTRVSAFPVVDDIGRVIGVASEADLLVKEAVKADGTSIVAAVRHFREDEKASGISDEDLMTAPAVTIGPDAPVDAAARLMYDRKVKKLPVVNHAGTLAGVISRVDVLAVFGRSDDEIVHQVIPCILADSGGT